MAAKSNKLTVVVPNEDDFKPAEIPFAVVSGEGVPDYDKVKSKGKRGENQFTATIILNKKEKKDFLETVMDYWEDNKPRDGEDEPANYDNIVREDKEDSSKFLLYAKSKTEFNGNPNKIAIVNHEGTKLDPEEFGKIGKGSEGRLAVTLPVYGDDEDAGVSVFLSAVKLTKFVAYVGGDASAAFGSEDGEVEGEGGFKSEKKKDKKRKKRSKDD